MTKKTTVVLSDELEEKMKKYPEVNWSEVARNAIESYVTTRVILEKRSKAKV